MAGTTPARVRHALAGSRETHDPTSPRVRRSSIHAGDPRRTPDRTRRDRASVLVETGKRPAHLRREHALVSCERAGGCARAAVTDDRSPVARAPSTRRGRPSSDELRELGRCAGAPRRGRRRRHCRRARPRRRPCRRSSWRSRPRGRRPRGTGRARRAQRVEIRSEALGRLAVVVRRQTGSNVADGPREPARQSRPPEVSRLDALRPIDSGVEDRSRASPARSPGVDPSGGATRRCRSLISLLRPVREHDVRTA